MINANVIHKSVVDKCNTSVFWSIRIDETIDTSMKEQVSVCVRYVRERVGGRANLEFCEDFSGFVTVHRTDAETITAAVDGFALHMDSLVGKGFDGAATMSGHVSVQLQQLHPKAGT